MSKLKHSQGEWLTCQIGWSHTEAEQHHYCPGTLGALVFPCTICIPRNWSSSSILCYFSKLSLDCFRSDGSKEEDEELCIASHGRQYGEQERCLDIKPCVRSPFSGVCFQNRNDHLPGCGDDVSDCCSYFLPSEANGALVNDGRDVNGRAEPLFNRSNRVISLFSGSTRTVPTLAMLTTNFINDPLISRPTFVHTSSLSFKWRLHQNILKYILGLIFIDPPWKA